MLGSTGAELGLHWAYTGMGHWWDVSLSEAVPALQLPLPGHHRVTPKSPSTAAQTGKTSLALPKITHQRICRRLGSAGTRPG